MTPDISWHVLLIDDDQDVLSLLTSVLTRDARFGAVQTAATVTDARESLSQACPDVVVLDLRLQPGSGTDLLPQLASACPDAVVVLHSVYSDLHPELVEQFDAVIRKGTDLLSLPQRLHDIASARGGSAG